MLVASTHSALPEIVDKGPVWVHLLPSGTFSGRDGRGPYHLRDPQAVIAASLQDETPRLVVDENHSTDLAGPVGNPSPARGWITRMEARADGLWGLVKWNASGLQLMADEAYNGVSPVFLHAKDGTVERVLRLSLTNAPNLAALALLHNQQDQSMDLPAIRKALGLAETADEAAILAAVQASATAVAAHSSSISAIAAAAGLTAAGAPELVTALQAQRAAAGDVARMATEIVGLKTELATLRTTGAKKAAEDYVDGQIRAGKPVASLRDHYVARHQVDAAAVERELSGMVSINAGGTVIHAKKPEEMSDEDMLTAEDKATCSRMGLDPKKFAANKRKMLGAAADRDGRAA